MKKPHTDKSRDGVELEVLNREPEPYSSPASRSSFCAFLMFLDLWAALAHLAEGTHGGGLQDIADHQVLEIDAQEAGGGGRILAGLQDARALGVAQVADVTVLKEIGVDGITQTVDALKITQAIEATGIASICHRKLPAERAVWLMLGMSLLRDHSIQAVYDHLHLVLPDEHGKTTISSAVLIQARARLGTALLQNLFNAVVTRHGLEQLEAHRWRGLAVLGIDGTTLRVPDSEEKRTFQPA